MNKNRISVDEFYSIVGNSFEEEFSSFMNEVCRKLNSFDEGISFDIIKNFDSTISIYSDNELITVVLKDENKSYFCRPDFLVRLKAKDVLKEIEDEIDEYADLVSLDINIINDLKYFNRLPENEKMTDYLYYLAILVINYFNLDITDSIISYYDNKLVHLDGNKVEFMEKFAVEGLETDNIVYMIQLSHDCKFISIMKIYEEERKTESFRIKINDMLNEF